jgi:hypothetical protein
MNVEELRSIFAGWNAQALAASGIEFRESTDPAFDPYSDDYRVIYEAAFVPAALDKGRIEFWLTDTGHVAVGIERYDRIVRRLELRGACVTAS